MYSNTIDFDDASKEWRKNKKYLGGGQFAYLCHFVHSNGKRCRQTIYDNEPSNNKNPYAYGFGGFGGMDMICRPKNRRNADIFCKKHLNRKRTTT